MCKTTIGPQEPRYRSLSVFNFVTGTQRVYATG